MSAPFLLLEACGALIAVLGLVMLVRAIVATRSRGGVECSVLRPEPRRGACWRDGTLRFATDELRWHRTIGFLLTAGLVIRRDDIEDVAREQADGSDSWVRVEIARTGTAPAVQMQMPPAASYALGAWIESAPARGDFVH
ncbi:DUF2550 domain-containing protein [Helcobacillus sp. ACRRO]|uniref:DUF2550 family protein n=1 Tax=Helcobacillus sp. ACRRO TaxID=2918202 RepID=UPI001EF6499C|nr:DUF2550 family protein [Helcobacillus sp. ACRRO]MCG7426808.1 DUF2550 domain-containing protein [Helcobacillus sp. ACRRO]